MFIVYEGFVLLELYKFGASPVDPFKVKIKAALSVFFRPCPPGIFIVQLYLIARKMSMTFLCEMVYNNLIFFMPNGFIYKFSQKIIVAIYFNICL